ncbi:hypothetical protein BC830DRAFT_1167814 [Chytriomyces sp. MP71]|nr:hypothetical protein BC830DRAFT_1167814 [Chytriomyces sp. MP71]
MGQSESQPQHRITERKGHYNSHSMNSSHPPTTGEISRSQLHLSNQHVSHNHLPTERYRDSLAPPKPKRVHDPPRRTHLSETPYYEGAGYVDEYVEGVSGAPVSRHESLLESREGVRNESSRGAISGRKHSSHGEARKTGSISHAEMEEVGIEFMCEEVMAHVADNASMSPHFILTKTRNYRDLHVEKEAEAISVSGRSFRYLDDNDLTLMDNILNEIA